MDNPDVDGNPVSHKCSSCDSAPSCWCVHCNEALCSTCLSAHRRVTLTKSHLILSQPPAGAGSAPPTRYCRLHPSEPLKLFCFTCKKTTCRDCQLISHMNHKYLFISEAIIGLKRKLDRLIQPITEWEEQMKKNLQDMETRLKDVSEREALLKVRLEDSYQVLTQHMRNRMEQLLKEAKEVDLAESRFLREKMERLKQVQQIQSLMTKKAETAKESNQVLDLLTTIHYVQTQMKTFSEESVSPPQTMSQVKVVSERPVLEALLNFGSLEVSWVPFLVDQSSSPEPEHPAAVWTSSSGSSSSLPVPASSGPYQTLGVQNILQPGSVLTAAVLQPVPQSTSVLQRDQWGPPPQNQSTCLQVPQTQALYQMVRLNPLSTALVLDRYAPPNTPRLTWSSTRRTAQQNQQNHFSRKLVVLPETTRTQVSTRPEQSVPPGHGPPLPGGPSEPSQTNHQSTANPPLMPRTEPQTQQPSLGHKQTKDQNLLLTCPQTLENPPEPTQKPSVDHQPEPSVDHQPKPTQKPAVDHKQEVEPSENPQQEQEPSVDHKQKPSVDRQQEPEPSVDHHPELSVQPKFRFSRYKDLLDRYPFLASTLLLVDRDQNRQANEYNLSPDQHFKPGIQQTPNPEPEPNHQPFPTYGLTPEYQPPVAPREGLDEDPSESQQTENPPDRKGLLKSSIPSPSTLKLQQPGAVVRAVADSACDSSRQTLTLRPQEPSENEPTSTVLEEPEPTPEVLEKDTEELGSVVECLDLKLTQRRPVVPLFRLPLQLAHPGRTGPGYRLVPGEAEDELYVEELSEDSEDADPPADIMGPLSSPESPLTLQMVCCSACGSANGSIICSACGRGFHTDCHVPTVDQNIWMDWTCSLCQDLKDPLDPYSFNRPPRPPGPCLGVQEQRKCETLLLYLKVEGCARLTQIPLVWSQLRLISDRLTLHRFPSYVTTAEFLWDVWRLFRYAVKEDDGVKSLQEGFQNKVTETFTFALQPGAQSRPRSKKKVKPADRRTHTLMPPAGLEGQRSEVTAKREEEEGECKLDKMRKRLREFIDIQVAKRRKMEKKTPPPSESHDQDL
ncbi:transcription intermediary factor 1-beta [Xyrichtys novacula]|uniref:Transcription intermediary factor 1-beta n=1 Tax=Xyrichtys novacula TaxID=13765 RepID=A0AAV1FJA2_XYRNO|nr:transcription intermediary factor 1-beta [Xyrichtys novacula]